MSKAPERSEKFAGRGRCDFQEHARRIKGRNPVRLSQSRECAWNEKQRLPLMGRSLISIRPRFSREVGLSSLSFIAHPRAGESLYARIHESRRAPSR